MNSARLNKPLDPSTWFFFPAKEGGQSRVGFDPTRCDPPDPPSNKFSSEPLSDGCPSSSPNLHGFESGGNGGSAQPADAEDGDQRMEEDGPGAVDGVAGSSHLSP